MTGINNVLARIEEIQKMTEQFQPIQFQENNQVKNKDFNQYMNDAVNQTAATPKAENVSSSQNASIMDMIKEASQKYKVPETLIQSVIKQESAFNPFAVSKAGAQGLMQLMPETAKELGVKDVFNPKENINGGTKYLRELLNKFDGNVPLSLAAYNAGPKRVMDSGGIPNIKETKNYVKKVFNNYQKSLNMK